MEMPKSGLTNSNCTPIMSAFKAKVLHQIGCSAFSVWWKNSSAADGSSADKQRCLLGIIARKRLFYLLHHFTLEV